MGRSFLVYGKQTQNIETDDILTVGGFTASDMPVWGICQIDMTQGGGGYDSDNKAWIGGPGQQSFGGNVSPTVPSFNGETSNWEFRVRQRAGNESIVCAYNRSVIECTDNNNFGGAFRIEEAGGSQALTLNHDGFNGIITPTFGKVKIPTGIITNSISADPPGMVDYRNVNILELTQADLTPGNCSVGQTRLDTGGATTELCYCRFNNSWVCTAMTPGPID